MQVHYVLEDLEKFGQHDSKFLRLPSVLCSERVIHDGIGGGCLFQERMKVLGCKRGSFLMTSHKITYLVKWSSQGTLRCLEVPLGILGDIYWFIVHTSEGQFNNNQKLYFLLSGIGCDIKYEDQWRDIYASISKLIMELYRHRAFLYKRYEEMGLYSPSSEVWGAPELCNMV